MLRSLRIAPLSCQRTFQLTRSSFPCRHTAFRRYGSETGRGTLGPVPSAAGVNDYETERKTFKLQRPEYYNFASDVIDYWAHVEQTSDVRQNRPAFWWVNDFGGEVQWSFQELSEKSKRVANMLTGPCRLSAGDRVLVILPKLPQWWLLNLACVRAGITLISATVQLTEKDIRYRLQRSHAKCVICDSTTAEKVDQVIDDCPTVQTRVIVEGMRLGWFMFEDMYLYTGRDFETARTRSADPSLIFFTSGTTGQPKMAEHSFSSYGLGHTITARHWLDLTPTDIMWNFSDPGWAKSAYSNVYAPWLAGACVFVHSHSTFEPELVLMTLERYPITTFCVPPTGYRMLLQANVRRHDLKNLRHCVTAAEHMNPPVLEHWLDETGKLIYEAYGQTETVIQCCNMRCVPIKPGSMGRPPPGFDLTILDENGKEVGPNDYGEIAVRVKPERPVGMFTRYIDEKEKMAKSFVGDYYVTGDLARRDEDGYFWFKSRSDDIIISSSYRIGPSEVESALLEHPAVAESAVVSSPDEIRGEVVKAFVVLTSQHQHRDRTELISELQEHCRRVTAPYKYPRKMEFVESLPKTISGKIRRVELRDREWNR